MLSLLIYSRMYVRRLSGEFSGAAYSGEAEHLHRSEREHLIVPALG
jgi:hypothetical protein